MDISVLLNIHREVNFIKRTMASIVRAIRYAKSHGLSFELVSVFDDSDEETRLIFEQLDLSAFNNVIKLDVKNRCLALSRNDGVSRCSGDYIALADADDLISINMYLNMFKTANMQVSTDTLVFPEYMLGFGKERYVWKYYSLAEVGVLSFISENCYVSRAFGRASIFRTFPFFVTHPKNNFFFEDWHFNANCIAGGVNITVAPETAIFYRIRAGSLMNIAQGHATRKIAECDLFKSETFLHAAEADYNAFLACQTYPESLKKVDNLPAILQNESIHLNKLEPNIYPYSKNEVRFGSHLNDCYRAFGANYFELCLLTESIVYEKIFFMPYMSSGGGEKFILNVMRELYEINSYTNSLVLLIEDQPNGATVKHLVPPNCTIIDFSELFKGLNLDQRCELVFKWIQNNAPGAEIHFKDSIATHIFLKSYSHLLPAAKIIYYRYLDRTRQVAQHTIDIHDEFDLVSNYFPFINMIITDNTTIIEKDHERLGFGVEKWKYLPARINLASIQLGKNKSPRKILWASRIDSQKRPSLLLEIGKQLSLQKADLLIDAFGAPVMDASAFCRGRRHSIEFRGHIENIMTIDFSEYFCFIYTSWFDGMPNVILEIASTGLPIVAPDVGGISEFIKDEFTGLLLPSLADDYAMAECYINGIKRLRDDADLRLRLSSNALDLLNARHSPAAFRRNVSKLFSETTKIKLEERVA